jgi:hypothetical protein
LHIQNSLASAGYLERSVRFGRPHFALTPLGERHFTQRPYVNCPNFLELYLKPEGMAEIDRLMAAGKLMTKATGLEPHHTRR